ncbi:disulfide bond formation protein B [Azohydromonas sp. G-1-1-14]|uniref:Disulfide bond formation protein B n=2 Tax=Azohydromonas caseinilytica TaxID=2728836 RepID=A0A848FDP3_9BURK|nr:disulfide bond formation protein B [Azohydromonas caseinilytica]
MWRDPLPGLITLASAGAIGAALVSQHVFGMEPCPWCVLQRLIFALIALAGLAAWTAQARLLRAMGLGLVLVLALLGVGAALWQHFVAASSTSCNLTLADRIIAMLGLDASLPEIFQPRASCADAAVDLLGLPYEFWSLAMYLLLGAAALLGLRRPGR